MSTMAPLERNDPRQYDDLAPAWWDESGPFAMLHWLAEARSRLIPTASRTGATLLDLGCGGGLLAPHIADKGYAHLGIDLTASALDCATNHGVAAVQGNVAALPLADASVDVVCAGEILEHVSDLPSVVAESCRVLRPGGTVVIDTIADTALARFLAVTVAERIHGGAPPGIHDPALFVNRAELVRLYRAHGVALTLRGLRPSLIDTMAWKLGRRPHARMLPTRFTAVVFQAWGTKAVA